MTQLTSDVVSSDLTNMEVQFSTCLVFGLVFPSGQHVLSCRSWMCAEKKGCSFKTGRLSVPNGGMLSSSKHPNLLAMASNLEAASRKYVQRFVAESVVAVCGWSACSSIETGTFSAAFCFGD